jgi:asparagine synthase (glutamine-hydrolysing)
MATAYGSLVTANGLKKDFNLDRALNERREILKKVKGDTLLRQRKYEMLTFLPDLLMRQDKMSMAHSIENRVPFLDNRLVSDALAISSNLLVGRHKGKKEAKLLLKQLCAARFNEKFAFREKMGFGVPMWDLMASPAFSEKWHDQISPGMKGRGVFETGLVEKWYYNLASTTPMQLDAVWMMTGFELWAQQYLG